MAEGSLKLFLTDVTSEPIRGKVNINFQPEKSSTGGTSMHTGDLDLEGATELTVEKVQCLSGLGTLYRVSIDAENYNTYSFFQMIMEDKVNKSPDKQIRLVINPGKVKDITASTFDRLPARLQAYLKAAAPIVLSAEDNDISGLSGSKLYDILGPLRKAGLLNLLTKAKHGTSAGVFRFFEDQTLLVLKQDRLFSMIDSGIENFLTTSELFKSAPNLLHKPLPGFERRASFKSTDHHANIQLTLMRETATGKLAADIDIDEASGIEHGFEVIRNKFKGRTSPYLVHDLLILAEVQELTLDPGYGFVFG